MSLRSKNNFLEKIIILIWVILLVISLGGLIVEASSDSTILEPEPSQYLEMRATKIQEVGGSKQVIFELWSHDLEFGGFDVRFQYDESKFEPSNIETNNPSTGDDVFKWEDEFKDKVEFWNRSSSETANNIVRAVVQIPVMTEGVTDPTEKESDHFKIRYNSEGQPDGYIVSTDESVLLGTMSFKMKEDKFDISGFELVNVDGQLPNGGIRIYKDETHSYENNPALFIFQDATASKDANLLNIKVSSEQEDLTEKNYDLSPTFDNQEPNEYTVTINDYIDTVKVTATTSHEKATMKIQVPNHNADGSLDYDGSDESSIQYKEDNLTSDVPLEVTLNKLGEPDTKITIIVTAEDGETTKEYVITIKRPYGIIKGSIYTVETTSKGIFKSDVRVYNSKDVQEVIKWNEVENGKMDDIHDKLIKLKSRDYKTQDDGKYEIYVIPGIYDVLLDKDGYLDHIYKTVQVNDGQTVDLENKDLITGDFNKDGIVNVVDLSLMMKVYGSQEMDTLYELKYDPNEDGKINVVDLSILMKNYTQIREIK